MGRRSSHTPDQLRELIVAAATELVVERGLVGLSAREIARKVGYSPGTIYNVFRDLDDLIFTIETRMLDQLATRLADLPPNQNAAARISALARVYLEFSLEKPRIWNLLMEHVPEPHTDLPLEFKERFDAVVLAVENILAPLVGTDKLLARRKAALLWAGLHGISTLATAQKLTQVSSNEALVLIDDFVTMFVAQAHLAPSSQVLDTPEKSAVIKQRKRVVAK